MARIDYSDTVCFTQRIDKEVKEAKQAVQNRELLKESRTILGLENTFFHLKTMAATRQAQVAEQMPLLSRQPLGDASSAVGSLRPSMSSPALSRVRSQLSAIDPRSQLSAMDPRSQLSATAPRSQLSVVAPSACGSQSVLSWPPKDGGSSPNGLGNGGGPLAKSGAAISHVSSVRQEWSGTLRRSSNKKSSSTHPSRGSWA